MKDGDGKIKVCSRCGECIYIFNEDGFQICPKCTDVVSYHQGED
ncbi:unnamed protein product [marine sediment metagenome]|uniref:Uncharacterized protein n=1 Tax=marine sediment metagenome TaxID=412755 RepID=X1GDD6_9ZZZZ